MTYVFYQLLKYRGIIILFLICISVFGFSTTIKDLSPSAAEYKAVLYLVEQKIMDVDPNGNFKPSLLVTKLDLARYLFALIDKYKLTNLQNSKLDNLDKIESRIVNLEKQVSSVSNQSQSISSLQKELGDLKKRISEVESKIITLESKSIDSAKSEAALVKRVSDIEAKLSNISQLRDFSKDISQLTAQINNLEAKLSAITQPKNYDNEIKQLKSQIANLEAKVNAISQAKSAEEINQLKAQMNDLETKIKTLTLSTYYDSQIENLKTKTKDLESKLNTTINMVSALADRVSKLEAMSSEDTKNLQSTTLNRLSEINKDVNEFKSQLLNEIEVLKARLKVIEEVVGQGQDFLQRLDALDALTIINTFSNLEVLSNRFDQLEARFKKLEDNLSQVVLEQRYILNELVVSQNSVKKFDSLEQKVSQLEASNSANNEDMKKLSAQVESLNSQVMTMRTITYVSLLISIVAGILVLLK